jgi:hypothetical protein
MHAYSVSNGLEIWKYQLENWVMSTPYIDGSTVYFGANDGNVYAVDSGNGNLLWNVGTQLAVQTMPTAGTMGGSEVIFVGSTDKSIYAIEKYSGQIVWKAVGGGVVGDPLFYQDTVIFGSEDGTISAYSTERACSITNPLEGDLVGLKEVVVTGSYVAESNALIFININDAGWESANVSDSSWIYYLDPENELNFGLNTISCMVTDDYGQENGPTYTTIAINHDPTITLSDFVVSTPLNIIEGAEFTVFVNDGDDGTPVDRINISVDGKSYFVDKSVNITIPAAGQYEVTVSKMGFNDATKTITVNQKMISPFVLVGAGLVILILVWQIWKRIGKKKRR